MNSSDRETGVRSPWWRERWVRVAAVVALIHVGLVWWLSPPDRPGVPQRAPARQVFVDGQIGGPEYVEWLWLMTPTISLAPSTHGFSGAAWLEAETTETPFEDFTFRRQPLPYTPMSVSRAVPMLMSRVDPSPAYRWDIPGLEVTAPDVQPVPLSDRGRVRIVSGLAGWIVPEEVEVPGSPGGMAPPPTTVKVVVDARGELVAPPVVWESSGVSAADEAALEVVDGLRFERSLDATTWPPTGELSWGLVVVEWPKPAGPAEGS